MKNSCSWDANQIRLFVKDAIKYSVGSHGWRFLGPEIQRAIVKAKALDVLCGQDESIPLDSNKVSGLMFAMLKEAKLEE